MRWPTTRCPVSNRRPAGACRWRCCPTRPATGAPPGSALRSASCSTGSAIDGGFGLWSANGEAEPWLSAYATEFLVRAQRAGALVPEQALRDALKFLADATDADVDTPDALAAQPYRLYVLALAGQGKPGLARVLYESLDKLPTPLAKAQLGAALALGHDTDARRGGVQGGAGVQRSQLLARRLRHVAARSRRDDGAAEGKRTAARPAGASCKARCRARTCRSVASPPRNGRGSPPPAPSLGRDGRPTRIALDGTRARPRAGGAGGADRPGDREEPRRSARSGRASRCAACRSQAPAPRRGPACASAASSSRSTARRSTSISSSRTRCSSCCVEGRAEDGQDHQAMMLQGLPAGWEIAGRFGAGKQAGMDWLGELSDTRRAARGGRPLRGGAGADRAGAVVPRRGPAARRDAGRLRMPGAELSDMYRPAVLRPAGRQPDQGARRLSRRPVLLSRARAGARLPRRRSARRRRRSTGYSRRNSAASPPSGRRYVDRNGRTVALLPAPGGVWRFADARRRGRAGDDRHARRHRGPAFLAASRRRSAGARARGRSRICAPAASSRAARR